MRVAVFKVVAALLALTSATAVAAGLPSAVREALKAAGVPQASTHVVVQRLDRRRPSVAVNAHEAVNPASVMKLFTTYAALELLGPAYRWKTEVYLDGEDLVLRGTGDPKLDYESFWMLLRNVRDRGVREFRDVVLDRSHFVPVAHDPVDDDIFRPYNVGPDALLVNFKSVRFHFMPEADAVRVFAQPAPPGLEVVNALKAGDGPCIEGRALRELMGASFRPVPPRAAFTGIYPAACGERDLHVALHHPGDYVAGVIRELWPEMGGRWRGTLREGIASPAAHLLYTHESPPLAEIVHGINKFSNNVMARQLYLTLAAEMGGPPARLENAWHAVRQWLDLKHIAAPELVIDNGSGLSRIGRASAATVAALLRDAWGSRVMPELVASLPVAGVDGTLRKRLLGEPVAGRAHVKTGLLREARAMAGYVLDRHGRRHVVVMIVNHPRAGETQAAQDALLNWVYEGATARGSARAGPRGGGPRRP